ncbi:MAG: hypothetical protein ABIO35_09945, partial [Nitrobacter sp.]
RPYATNGTRVSLRMVYKTSVRKAPVNATTDCHFHQRKIDPLPSCNHAGLPAGFWNAGFGGSD